MPLEVITSQSKKTYIEEVGRITDAFLGIEDHGILTTSIMFDFGGSGQGCGQYSWDGADPNNRTKRIGSPQFGVFVRKFLEVCGVDDWQKLKGRVVLVLREEPYGLIKGIRQLKIDGNKEFIFDDIFEDK